MLSIRNPQSTRPWQHVLEVLYGYMTLAVKLKENKKKIVVRAFNFGPSNQNYKVINVLKIIKRFWPKVSWKLKKKE